MAYISYPCQSHNRNIQLNKDIACFANKDGKWNIDSVKRNYKIQSGVDLRLWIQDEKEIIGYFDMIYCEMQGREVDPCIQTSSVKNAHLSNIAQIHCKRNVNNKAVQKYMLIYSAYIIPKYRLQGIGSGLFRVLPDMLKESLCKQLTSIIVEPEAPYELNRPLNRDFCQFDKVRITGKEKAMRVRRFEYMMQAAGYKIIRILGGNIWIYEN